LQQQLIIIRQNKIGQLTVIVREARNLPAINLTGKRYAFAYSRSRPHTQCDNPSLTHSLI